MSLPRKYIAEGIAVAIMVGVGGERGARQGDRWQSGEVYMFVAGHALRNPIEEDVRRALASSIVQPMRQIVSDTHIDAETVDRLVAALRARKTAEPIAFTEGDLSGVEPIRIRLRASSGEVGSGITLTSKHGRCYEVVS